MQLLHWQSDRPTDRPVVQPSNSNISDKFINNNSRLRLLFPLAVHVVVAVVVIGAAAIMAGHKIIGGIFNFEHKHLFLGNVLWRWRRRPDNDDYHIVDNGHLRRHVARQTNYNRKLIKFTCVFCLAGYQNDSRQHIRNRQQKKIATKIFAKNFEEKNKKKNYKFMLKL